MIRFLIATGFLVAANAIGLLIAVWLVPDMTMTAGSFLTALLIFTGVGALVRPFLMSLAVRHFDFLMGGTALVATFIALAVTAWLSDGLHIEGAGGWAMATLVVWGISVLAGVLLPALLLKRGVQSARGNDKRPSGRTWG